MKVVHFIRDDKFVNGTISFLEEFDFLENSFYILSDEKSFKYISLGTIHTISVAQLKDIISNPESCDVIVIHGLLSLPCKFIQSINKKIKVVWFSLGYDIYNNTYPQFPLIQIRNMIKPQTLDLTNKIIFYSKRFVKEFLMRALCFNNEERRAFEPAINRIDYYSGVYPVEYDLMKLNSFFRAKQVSWSYVSPSTKKMYRKEDIYKDILPKGNYIQVGNNASIICNHRNVFNILNKLNLDDRKIVVPLSYGPSKHYIASVCKAGNKCFGDNFVPLMNFMPKDDYISFMSSISIAIYNTERQSAAGNIRMGLWNGTMVFLPETSIGYSFFRKEGFHVFTIEKDLTQENIDRGLTEEQIIENRELLSATTRYDVLKERVFRSFESIRNDIEEANYCN